MVGRMFITLAAALGLIGVGAGAFGAHALEEMLVESGRVDTYETAVRYQMYHALALLAVGLLQRSGLESFWLGWSGWMFLAGVLIFSGSLYLLIFTGVRWLGAITPIGGVAFILGWIFMILSMWR